MNWTDKLDIAMQSLSCGGGFLTTDSGETKNTMTISWGYIGYSWHQPVFVAMVRPQRYTYELIKDSTRFTISIPELGNMKNELQICGTKSGRDIDKAKVVDYIPCDNGFVIDGCKYYYECKIKYMKKLDSNCLSEDIKSNNYKENDFHYMVVGEIVKCYER